MRLVYDRPHHRVPYDVDDTDHEEHHGHDGRVQPVHIIIIKEQPDADSLVDQVLRQVARAEADALPPREPVTSVDYVLHSSYQSSVRCQSHYLCLHIRLAFASHSLSDIMGFC